ncbi:hypothetical protein ACWEOI_14930 [Nocardia sp. NPDC004340]
MSSDNQWSVQAIIDRIEREKRQTVVGDRATEEPAVAGYSVRGLWSCYSDPGKLTAAQAHTMMQLHLGCGVDTCLVRSRARDFCGPIPSRQGMPYLTQTLSTPADLKITRRIGHGRAYRCGE